MKKLLSIILVFSIVIVLCPVFTANAAEYEKAGDFLYRILEDDTIEICSYTGNSEQISIYSSIGGRTVTSVADNVFMGNKTVTRLVIPSGMKHIGKNAFANCTNLRRLEIYSDVLETIGDYAFVNCYEVGYFRLPLTVKYIGKYAVGALWVIDPQTDIPYGNYDPYAIIIAEKGSLAESYALQHDMYLYDNVLDFFGDAVTIKDDGTAELIRYSGKETNVRIADIYGGYFLTSIGPSAFMNNRDVESVYIPSEVESIGDYSFFGCANLSKVEMPEDLKLIGNEAFTNCPSLKELKIPYGANYFGDHAFGFETHISSSGESEYFPVSDFCLKCYRYSGAETAAKAYGLYYEPRFFYSGDFEYSNFYGYYAIVENYFGDSTDVYVPNYFRDLPVYKIGTGSFTYNHSVESVTLSKNILTIDEKAFFNCYNLYSITMPNVHSVGKSAFAGCSSLETIDMPSVEEIGYGAFYECTSLSDVSFGENLVSIGEIAFFNCESLNHLSLPLSVTDIGNYAMGCYNYNEELDHRYTKWYPYFNMTVYEHTISKDYARAFDFSYSLMGDANKNGRAEINDITKMQRALADIDFGGKIDRDLVDVNHDGKFDINDVTLQQKILAYMYET